MKTGKTKPENLGLGDRSSHGFGFEKVRVNRAFEFGQARVANPSQGVTSIERFSY